MNTKLLYLVISNIISITYFHMNLYDIDNSIKIKDPLWKMASGKYFSFMEQGLLHYEDTFVDILMKLRSPIFYIFWIIYFAFQGDESIPFWFGLLNIIMSLIFYAYSTFIYNKISGKNQCNYTQLTIPSLDLYLIPKFIFIVTLILLYYKTNNIIVLSFIVGLSVLYLMYSYLIEPSRDSLKCYITHIGGIYLYLNILAIITFIKGM